MMGGLNSYICMFPRCLVTVHLKNFIKIFFETTETKQFYSILNTSA